MRLFSTWSACLHIAVGCICAQAGSFLSQSAYLKASNTEAFDWFGGAVAVSGDTIAVGASGEDGSAFGVDGNQSYNYSTNSGAVYVFVRQGDSWIQQAYVKASNPDPDDQFGSAVALSGNTLVIGAYKEDSNARGINGDQFNNTGTNSGAVYVYERTGTNWARQAYLKLSNTEFGEEFGRSVAISGDTIVVGARIESSGASGVNGDQFNNDMPAAGAAYVFVRAGTNWTQQAYLKASNPDVNDFFGWRVAISGDTIAASALFEDSRSTGVNGDQLDNSMTNSGAVYIFTRAGTNWTQQAYLKASNADSTAWLGNLYGDEFGHDISLLGNTLVVGARNESSNAAGVNGNQTNNSSHAAGAAYVFVRTGTNWTQQAYLKASNPLNISYFGWSVAALSEDKVLVGASQEWSNATGIDGDQTNFNANSSGAAYLFARNGTNWSQVAYIKASNTGASDRFGTSLAGTGSTLLFGAPYESSNATGIEGNQADNSAPASGAAYVFTLTEPPPQLSLTRAGLNTLRISWPSSSLGWNLQQSTTLGVGNWTTPPEPIVDDSSSISVTVDTTTGSRFFRLAR